MYRTTKMIQPKLTRNHPKILFYSSIKLKHFSSGGKHFLWAQKNLLWEIPFTFFRMHNAFGIVQGSYYFLVRGKDRQDFSSWWMKSLSHQTNVSGSTLTIFFKGYWDANYPLLQNTDTVKQVCNITLFLSYTLNATSSTICTNCCKLQIAYILYLQTMWFTSTSSTLCMLGPEPQSSSTGPEGKWKLVMSHLSTSFTLCLVGIRPILGVVLREPKGSS